MTIDDIKKRIEQGLATGEFATTDEVRITANIVFEFQPDHAGRIAVDGSKESTLQTTGFKIKTTRDNNRTLVDFIPL